MIIKLVNKKGETVGFQKQITYCNKKIAFKCYGYVPITLSDKKEILRKLNIAINEEIARIDEENRKERHKKSLMKFLNRITRNEFLTIQDMRKAVSLYSGELVYLYDLISALDNFNVTKKGISCIDGLDNKVYLYDYKFYKSNFLGM